MSEPLGSQVSDYASLRDHIRADHRSRGADRSIMAQFIIDPVARFMILMRLLEYIKWTPLSLPLRLWFRRLSIRLGFSIQPGIFGPGLAIVDYGQIIIDPTARIGRNCRIHQEVNVGGTARILDPEDAPEFSPRIGHNVYIGPGAQIFGPVVIGDECTIGANAVVNRSFPAAGQLLMGIPAKAIRHDSIDPRVIRF